MTTYNIEAAVVQTTLRVGRWTVRSFRLSVGLAKDPILRYMATRSLKRRVRATRKGVNVGVVAPNASNNCRRSSSGGRGAGGVPLQTTGRKWQDSGVPRPGGLFDVAIFLRDRGRFAGQG